MSFVFMYCGGDRGGSDCGGGVVVEWWWSGGGLVAEWCWSGLIIARAATIIARATAAITRSLSFNRSLIQSPTRSLTYSHLNAPTDDK